MNRRFDRAKWKKMRKDHLAVYPECRVCGTLNDVVVHHLRYRGKRGESERPGDLMTLCAEHHNALHATILPKRTSVHGTIEFVNAEVARLYRIPA